MPCFSSFEADSLAFISLLSQMAFVTTPSILLTRTTAEEPLLPTPIKPILTFSSLGAA